MALSEIEKLERRYAENPQGLTFAPLAEVHRKTGDVARALDLLRPGLEHHPDYIPASIVLGRCHLDLGDLPAAETAFTHVLSLDGENVIALKALADISERLHHFDQAERWLHTLLSVDRSNDDARAQLERIGSARRDSASAPPPPTPEEGGVSSTAVAEGEVLDLAPAAAADAVPAEPPPPAIQESAPIAGWVSASDHEAVPLPLADLEPSYTGDEALEPLMTGLEPDEPRAMEEPVEPLAGLTGRETRGSGQDGGDFNVELGEDIVLRSSGAHEFQVPDAAAELSDRTPFSPPSPFGDERAPVFGGLDEPSASPAQPPRAAAPEEPAPPTAAGDDSSLSRWPSMSSRTAEPERPTEADTAESTATEATAAEPPSPPSPYAPPIAESVLAGEPPVTAMESAAAEPAAYEAPPRSMDVPEAAVPHSAPATSDQSHRERPPVVVSEPEPDMVVTETMAQVLLNQGHSVEALEVYRELEVRNAGDHRLRQKIADLEEEGGYPPAEGGPPESARRQYSAGETGGRSVRDFFQGMLSARPPAAPPAPPVAHSVASSAPAQSSGAPTRPAADALSLSSVFGEETTALPPAVPTAGAAPAASGVSFDEFYSPPGTSAAPKSRAPDPKNDDLDQFHAWLQNLKR